jgi:hypothetical protein
MHGATIKILKKGPENVKTPARYWSQPLTTERQRGNRSRDELFIDYYLSETEKKNYRQSFVCDYLQLINVDSFTSVRVNGSSGDRTKATDLLKFATYAYKLHFCVALTTARPVCLQIRESSINHSSRLSVLVSKVMDHFPVEWFIKRFKRLKKLRKSGECVAQE